MINTLARGHTASGENTNNNTLDCTGFSKAVDQFVVTLSPPNIATDAKGNNGTFTLIYDEGVEIRINGLVFFAYSYYYYSSSGNVVSVCNTTFPGWFHTLDVNNPAAPAMNWGCFVGNQQSSQPQTQTVKPQETIVSALNTDDSEIYRNDWNLIKQINHVQSSWRATAYKQFEGVPMREMVQRAGGSRATQDALRQAKQIAQAPERLPTHFKPSQIPAAWDWRNVSGVNYVSPIRDQGGCGSCYAFASVGMLEARIRWFSNNTELPILSPQNIVSCSQYSQGCAGGWPYLSAGKYGHDFGHIEESCYPYTGQDSKCQPTCSAPKRWRVSDYHYINGYYGASTVTGMQLDIIKNGPLAVSFEVYNDFMSYSSGVYVHNDTAIIPTINPFILANHCVLIIGWGFDQSTQQEYWIVKNSWGEHWGLAGYFWIKKNAPQYGGECGIESLTLSALPILH